MIICYFRIKAINEVGLSEGAATKEFANIPKETTTYVKPVYPEMNFDLKPEFTTVLNNRKIMVGYTGVITCALKGAPRPKLRWFRNKMEIIDNPKYKISWGQGKIIDFQQFSQFIPCDRYYISYSFWDNNLYRFEQTK